MPMAICLGRRRERVAIFRRSVWWARIPEVSVGNVAILVSVAETNVLALCVVERTGPRYVCRGVDRAVEDPSGVLAVVHAQHDFGFPSGGDAREPSDSSESRCLCRLPETARRRDG